MKKPYFNINSIWIAALCLLLLGQCAPYRKNIFSKTYHNTTANYNAYFIARQEISEVQQAVYESRQNDYNKILPIFPDIDSTTIDPLRTKLKDCIEKASLPIQRHENSKWVDDCYYLVGMARFYAGDFVNAIETFKYVNTKSDDDVIRHTALVALMRTFIHYKEDNNALAVSDYLKKQKLNKANKKDLYLTRAYMYQLRDDYQEVVPNLKKALGLIGRKKDRARYYFILGQIYQQAGKDSLAYFDYRRVLKSNPEYELSFYAKLNMAQVTRLDQKTDIKKIRRYFTKLLKDSKNQEFKDKIYYEMGRFELKHNQLDKAVENFQSSIRASRNDAKQKAYAYLELGKLYFEHYKKYTLAKDYYDSTVAVLPKTDERYESIKSRQEILADFVTQINTIQLQDSLLNLAAMNAEDLSRLLDAVIEQQQEQAKIQERAARKKAAAAMAGSQGSPFPTQRFGDNFGNQQDNNQQQQSGGTWYFYNDAAVSAGRSQFLTKWGNRPLEDNWRRAQKGAQVTFQPNNNENKPVASDSSEAKTEAPKSQEDMKAKLMENIPFSPEAKQAANAKLEEAFYKLGNIYNFKLEEDSNAVQTYETFLKRFPESEYVPEVLYSLYLMLKDQGNDRSSYYKDQLTTRFPETVYAKLAQNPNYTEESNQASVRLKKIYEIAFDYYEKGDLDQARLLVSRALQQYPDNPFSDHLKLLGVMVDGKTEGQYKYQFELQQYIDSEPDSLLKIYAQGLLQSSQDFKAKEAQRTTARYIADFDQPHFFIVTYENKGDLADKVPAAVDKFAQVNFPNLDLKIGNLTLNEEQLMVLVNKFQTKDQAMKFYEKFTGPASPIAGFKDSKFNSFVITEDNFQIFYQAKKTDDYLKFFNEHYLNKNVE